MLTRRAAFGLVSYALLIPIACTDDGRREGGEVATIASECRRPGERHFEAGDTVVVDQVDGYPCRIELVETGPVLVSNLEGSVPDPGTIVLADSRGRIYTDVLGMSRTIAVWDSAGRFERSFGQEGDGPREFEQYGVFDLFVDREDNLHVFSGLGQWTVLSAESEWLSRTQRMPRILMQGRSNPMVMPRGEIVMSPGNLLDRRPLQGFAVLTAQGEVLRTFGEYPEYGGWGNWASHARHPIAVADEDHFWAGPSLIRSEYLVEKRALDGQLTLVVRRQVPWFPDEEPPVFADERPNVPPEPPSEPPHPSLRALNADTTGLLVTYTQVPTEDWVEIIGRCVSPLDEPPEDYRNAYSAYIEIIDTRAGVVLASRHLASWFDIEGFLPGRLRAFRRVELPSGLIEIRFVDIVLSGAQEGR